VALSSAVSTGGEKGGRGQCQDFPLS